MRRLLLLLAVTALVVAACGDDEAATTTQSGDNTTVTSGSTETTGGATGFIAKAEGRRDPAEARSTVLSRQSRTGGGATQTGGDKETATTVVELAYGDRGSDPLLDLLWDDCAAGDMGACDQLYRQAPLGSEYEAFGDTCGATTEGGTWCETGVDVTDPYLYGIYDACADGDMAACDTLYLESPAGSHFEWFGYTCGLISDGSVWCTELIPDETSQRLDDLYAACAAGDMQACDDLYLESPAGSDYEEFGRTCGDRTDGSRWCVDEPGTSEINDYGDDAYLDGLWDDCAAGDMSSCDALYLESPAGSVYEEFGDTCGGLTAGGTWCVDGGPGTATGECDDPTLDALYNACAGGDWQACDDLYNQSPLGSACEAFGDTCGGLTAGGTWCVDTFGSGTGSACDDPALDALYNACAGGDWQACDDLYMQSPTGSDCEEFGDTCAYTTDGSEWCVDFYGGGSACGDPALDALYDACAGGDWQACDDLYMESPSGSDCEEFGDTCAYTTDGGEWCVDVYGG